MRSHSARLLDQWGVTVQDYSISPWVCITGKVNICTYTFYWAMWHGICVSLISILITSFKSSATVGSTLFDCSQETHQCVCVCSCVCVRECVFNAKTLQINKAQCTIIWTQFMLKTHFTNMVCPENICEMCQNSQWDHVFEIMLLYSSAYGF